MAITIHVARPTPPAAILIDIESVTPELSNKDVKVAKELPAFSYGSYMTISVPVCKRKKSSKIAMSLKNVA